jgi:cellulose synthase/poly-beta-1,6-N-acetylglucosamine synthase-like glycosyltransferase
MIGVIVPAHNEQALLSTCLAALHAAARHADLGGEPVCQIVVLDTCTDFSGAIARAYGVQTLTVRARNVGIARAAGAAMLVGRTVVARRGRGMRVDSGRRLVRASRRRARAFP